MTRAATKTTKVVSKRSRKLDLLKGLGGEPPDDDGPWPAQQVRNVYPELTRCMKCNGLDEQIERHIITVPVRKRNPKATDETNPWIWEKIVVATYWLHPQCWEQVKDKIEQAQASNKFDLHWTKDKQGNFIQPSARWYHPNCFYPHYTPVPPATFKSPITRQLIDEDLGSRGRFNYKFASECPRATRDKSITPHEHARCLTCENHELREHKAHRFSVGYHPGQPWLGHGPITPYFLWVVWMGQAAGLPVPDD